MCLLWRETELCVVEALWRIFIRFVPSIWIPHVSRLSWEKKGQACTRCTWALHCVNNNKTWLSTGLTIHKEIKHKIYHLVSNAKSTFYSVELPSAKLSKNCVQYRLTVRQDYIHPTAFCLSHSSTSTGPFFSFSFCQQGSPNVWFFWQSGYYSSPFTQS